MKKLLKIIIPIFILSSIFLVLFLLTQSQNQQDLAIKQAKSEAQTKINKSTKDTLKHHTEADITYHDQKINLYLFWGDGCPHCKSLGDFLASLPEEYTSLYQLYSFETWQDKAGSKLMLEFATAINQEPSGVPFLIVGDQAFTGFSLKSDSAPIKAAIKAAHAKLNSADRSTDLYQKVLKARN